MEEVLVKPDVQAQIGICFCICVWFIVNIIAIILYASVIIQYFIDQKKERNDYFFKHYQWIVGEYRTAFCFFILAVDSFIFLLWGIGIIIPYMQRWLF